MTPAKEALDRELARLERPASWLYKKVGMPQDRYWRCSHGIWPFRYEEAVAIARVLRVSRRIFPAGTVLPPGRQRRSKGHAGATTEQSSRPAKDRSAA